MTRIRQLFELGQGDTASVCAKAANLGALASHGLPVPPGVAVVATETDDGIEAAVAEGLAVLGDGPLAVRSSALAEDLDGASFAGQYETVLDVRGADAVVEAVRRVRAAADHERVAGYRSAHGPTGVSGIGVLLMPMIAAEVSGVAFTAHPLTGAPEETVVTATIGLGEQLVGGEATGEQWIVRDGQPVRDRRAPVRVLQEAQTLAVAELARVRNPGRGRSRRRHALRAGWSADHDRRRYRSARAPRMITRRRRSAPAGWAPAGHQASRNTADLQVATTFGSELLRPRVGESALVLDHASYRGFRGFGVSADTSP